MILTISIPTYNRADKVLDCIKKIIPQLCKGVVVNIHDNCSHINVEDYLIRSISNLKDLPIYVFRNKVNIGPDANFARCFEYSNSKYTWILSDDDLIAADAISNVINDINKYDYLEPVGFNFNSNCNLVNRNHPILVKGIKELINGLDFFGNWLFLSTSVYNTSDYLSNIRYAYFTAYSMASQISPALVSVSKDRSFIFSEKYIVTNIPVDDIEQKWSNVKITLSLLTLLELPIDLMNEDYLKLGRKMNTLFVTMSHVLISIVKSLKSDVGLVDKYHLYIVKQIHFRTIEFRQNKLKHTLLYYLTIFLLENKVLFRLFIRTAFFKSKSKNPEIATFKLFKRKS